MIIHDNTTPNLKGSVVAIGVFDGIHLGHQAVIKETIRNSKHYQVPSVVYTFDPPPRAFFQNSITLTNIEQKIDLIKSIGVDQVIVARFNLNYQRRSAETFIKELKRLNPQKVLVGQDFHFGAGRKGDVNLLKRHFVVEAIEPIRCRKGEIISSTRIRKLINRGETREAVTLLG